jgi:hypothetical protein
MEEVLSGLLRRAQACEDLRDDKNPPTENVRLTAKAVTYNHAAELVKDALERGTCKHERVFSAGGHASDRHSWHGPGDVEGVGYMPRGLGLGGGDGLEIEVCIDCHKALGLSPAEAFLNAEEG